MEGGIRLNLLRQFAVYHATSLRWTTLALLTLAIASGLVWVGNTLTASALITQARIEMNSWRHHSSPWHWQIQHSQDLVAGRVFGQARLQRQDGHLVVIIQSSREIELGLPLSRPANLLAASVLVLSMNSNHHLNLRLIVRESLHSAAHFAHLPQWLPGPRKQRFELGKLHWTDASGHPLQPPHHAAMFRLAIRALPGSRLQSITAKLRAPGIAKIAATPSGVNAFLARHPPYPGVPVVALPEGLQSSTMLALRSQVQSRDPAAIVVPAGQARQVYKSSSQELTYPKLLAWVLIVLTGLGMLAVTRFPPQRLRQRAVLEALLACLPIVLIAFGFGSARNFGMRTGVLSALTLAFAMAISLRHPLQLAPWHWLTPARTWWIPALAPVAALALFVYFHGHSPTPGDAARYTLWATLQQVLLQIVVARRLAYGLDNPHAAVLFTATLFALMHAPNTSLMLLTFLAGLLWTGWFLRQRGLLPVAIAHAIGAVLLQGIASQQGWLHSLAIGARYLR